MAPGMFEYPAANTRARTIKAKLLQPQDWQALMNAADLPGALRVLGATDYRGALDAAQAGGPASMRMIEHALRSTIIAAMQKLLRFLRGSSRTVPELLVQRYELLNIKKTLRRLSQPERRESRLAIANYELGSTALVKDIQWDELKTPEDLRKALDHTFYRRAYRMGVAAFSDSHDLLMFESRLEKAYYDELTNCTQGLGLTNCTQVRAVLGSYFDEVCLTAFARFRYQNGLDASAIYPLLPLKACRKLTEHFYWTLAATTSEAACIAALGAHARWARIAGSSLRETYQNLRRERLRLCRFAFVKSSPISPAPVIAYHFLKEIEAKDIMAVLHCKRFNVPVPQEACVCMDVAGAA